jgi:hypothetical protein
MSMSRWLTWTPPNSQIIDKPPEHDPSKPTKHSFEGFAGANLAGFQKIRALGPGNSKPRVFPHCPRCASYDLYRRNNIGDYECQTCGLREIEEFVARRTQ